MDSDARHDFAAAYAPHSPRKDRRLVIPDPKSLPESEEESDGGEETSPSQYKLARMREESHISDGSDDRSSDGDVEIPEEEYPPDEYDHEVEVAPRAVLNKKAALKVDCDAMVRNLNAMSQQLQAVMRLQMQHKRDKRQREKRQQYDDVEDGDPGPATLEFTPPRKKLRELVSPTPESDDDDLESLVSHASSTRKKVQPKFIFVDSKDTPKCNQAEIRAWLQSYAIEQMNKAGPYIDKRPRETDLGGMKLSQISAFLFCSCFSCSLQVLTYFSSADIYFQSGGRISSPAISLSIPQEVQLPICDFDQDVTRQGYDLRVGRAHG